MDQLLLHNVTAHEPERLVEFNHGPWSSYPNFQDIRASGVFAGLAANTHCYPEPRWREGDQTHPVSAECVSGNYFAVTGVQAARGRVFTEDEAAAEKNPRVVVVSHPFWQRRLGGDPNVIGRVLTLNHTAYTIIGVSRPITAEVMGAPPKSSCLSARTCIRVCLSGTAPPMGLTGRLLPTARSSRHSKRCWRRCASWNNSFPTR